MTENYERLIKLLKELFQIDRPDLDFGIYRIMNQKRDEITAFLDKDLLPQVKKAFVSYGSGGRGDVQAELDKMVANLKDAGIDPDSSPKVKELKDKLNAAVDVTELENEVYSHLYNFFRRYYKDGDFLSLRRYKKDVYAIPYEGEEVKLHWANADQYYIKSSENFRDYTFKLGELPAEGEEDTRKTVHFKLIEADTELANNKAQEGKERRFVLCSDLPMIEDDGELFIRFEYKPLAKKQTQKSLNETAVKTILDNPEHIEWIRELAREENGTSILGKHLNSYTAKNSFDYFIHKDLGGFLRRELDFFIKNEVMHLDDIEEETVPRVEQYLSQIKVLRQISHKLIRFLQQLENFQKKLWLKKKFVVETNYCITLDRVPEELYPEICANDAQRMEWIELFAIDQIENSLTTEGYSSPLTPSFLKQNKHLLVDTIFFSNEFTKKILCKIDCLDASCDGVLFHAENYGVMQTIIEKYRGKVNTVFIDPPYNTGGDGFIYKDSYFHSSWISMLYDRVMLSKDFLSAGGSYFQTIDDTEHLNSKNILNQVFGENLFLANIVWQRKYGVSNNAKGIGPMIDHILAYKASDQFVVQLFPRSEEARARYRNPDKDHRGPWKAVDYWNQASPEQRPNLVYTITNPHTGNEINPSNKAWKYAKETYESHVRENRIYWGTEGQNTVPTLKRFLSEVRDGVVPSNFWSHEFAGHTDAAKKMLEDVLGPQPFQTPKPTKLIEQIITLSIPYESGVVFDYFAGSGTTAHSVINYNRKNSTNIQYILVEIGSYFNTVLLPRVKKVIYSDTWKDGKPESRNGITHMFKYHLVESYEDALNNLRFKRSDSQGGLLTGSPALKEEYMLTYMMDLETEGSASLLNVNRFDDPWNYTMKIATGSAGETRTRPVDLVETFNYLIGLTVIRRDFLKGIEVIEGTNPAGENVLVIWRNTRETNNEQLDEFFRKQDFNTRDSEFALIYVNGDNNLENLKRPDETWKVRLIEEDFKRLMFEVENV